jgi:multimeric flavodoxin WrbA
MFAPSLRKTSNNRQFKARGFSLRATLNGAIVPGSGTSQPTTSEGENIMKILALNGSPRKKNWNTVTLLEHALAGAAAAGAETQLVQLYDLKFSGCISCFSCKKRDRQRDGVCAVQDDLTGVLEAIREADGFIIGSPIYYGTESAATRALIERLCFPYNSYARDLHSLFPRRIRTALIYTMNVGEEFLEKLGYHHHFNLMQMTMERHFGKCSLLCATDTLQFNDYDKYASERFDAEAKQKRHEEIFPVDCRKAFALGEQLVKGEQ